MRIEYQEGSGDPSERIIARQMMSLYSAMEAIGRYTVTLGWYVCTRVGDGMYTDVLNPRRISIWHRLFFYPLIRLRWPGSWWFTTCSDKGIALIPSFIDECKRLGEFKKKEDGLVAQKWAERAKLVK